MHHLNTTLGILLLACLLFAGSVAAAPFACITNCGSHTAPDITIPVMPAGAGSIDLWGGHIPQLQAGIVPAGTGRGTSAIRTTPDPFAMIDEKLTPSEAAGLKSLIQNTLHAFSYDAATGDWYARNAANQITFTYTRTGTAKFSEGENAFGLTLIGIGRGDGIFPAGKGIVQADRLQLNITRQEYTEWYKNNDEGVEQGMTLASSPDGTGHLKVVFDLSGTLTPTLERQTLVFSHGNSPVFRYYGLTARDATGRNLPVMMSLTGTRLVWQIDDHNAVYPITIDPYIATQNAALTASDAASESKFGWSVAIYNDTAIVGASYAKYGDLSEAGKAYIFKNNGGTWSQVGSPLNASDATKSANFGWSVSIYNDTALVGAYQAKHGDTDIGGETYVFKNNGGTWSEVCSPLLASDHIPGGHFGSAVSIYNDTAIIGSYQAGTPGQSGQAYIFKNGGGTWSQVGSALTASDAAGSAHFGWSASIYNDTAIVGAYDANSSAGKAYIFKNSGGTWSQIGSPLEASDVVTGDYFGWSVSIYNDTAIVGAYYANNRAGKVYVFKNNGGTWNQFGSPLIASDDASYSEFGYSVSMYNETAIVGARRIYSSSGKGKAYIFKNSGGTWGEISNFNASGGDSGDFFGASVSIFNNTANVGANEANSKAGKAYIFTFTEAAPAPVASFTSTNVSVVTNSTAQGWAGVSPVTMQFTDTSTNTPTSWNWARNNLTSTAWTVFNTSQNARDSFWTGNWSVNLTATNSAGSGISSQTLWMNVSSASAAPAPVASFFTSDPTSGTAPLAVTFTDQSTNIPTGWAWFFGDENWTVPAWTRVNASSGWSKRYSHTSVAMPDGSIVLMGGQDSVGYKNDVWRSTNNGTSWTQQKANAEWSARYGHTSVAMPDGSIVLMGGYGTTYYHDVWRSTNNGASWTQQTANAGWSARKWFTSVSMPDGSIVLMGGNNGISLNDVWNSTDNGNVWTRVTASAEWSARNGHTSVAMPDGSIVLMGGNDGNAKNDVWRSTNNGTMWTEVNTNADWSARYGHTSVAMPDGSIVLMGGNAAASYYNDVWNSLDNGASWTKVNASAGWTARKWFTSVAIPDGSIVLMGGYDGTYYNDVWNSTDIGATWTQVTTSGTMWSARNGHTSVVMPDGSIVLMGGNDGSSLNDVWRSTNNGTTWTQMKANAVNANNWSARSGHTSVAMPDGSIVLMGGRDSGGYKNDVWRSTDIGATWTRVNASAGWSARDSHTSVVMPNSSIVLMGGIDGSSTRYNDTWLFQPANSSAQSPSHTYTAAGTYNVSLQAYNAVGYNSTRKAGYITVTGSTTPVASFSSRNTSTSVATNSTSQGWAGVAPFTMVFNDTSTGPPTSWVWNATNVTGNNVPFYINTTTVTLANISYSFRTAGNYTIKLNATNSGGSGISGITWVNVSSTTLTFTSITPNSGPTAGGTAVSIIGANFVTGGSLGVTIGGANANAVFVDSTHLTATTPAGSAGAQNIVITNNDGGTVTGTGAYTYVAPTPAPTPTNSGGDSDGPAAPVAPLGPVAPVVPGRSSTSEVNVGGNSAVTQVTITGIGISDVIVTGTVVSGPGLNTAPPTPMVYEYVDITPARYTTISDAMISFTVPITWLTERQLTPPNVVMYHLVEQTWVALPTTLVKVENGVAYYTAASPGFSRFAITGQFNITSATPLATPTPAAPLATLTPTGQTFGDLSPTTSVTKTPTPSATVTIKPVTSQTTAILAAPQPAPPLPLPTIAIVAGVVVVLVAGGFLIRRWWIRRQNPALFRELD